MFDLRVHFFYFHHILFTFGKGETGALQNITEYFLVIAGIKLRNNFLKGTVKADLNMQ